MRLLLLGGTGRIGRRVLAQALADGHDVIALSRHPQAIAPQKNLQIAEGDATDALLLGQLMVGREVIISTLGHFGPKYSDVSTTAAKTILAHLNPEQRYIAVTGQVPDPKDPPQPLLGQIANAIIKLLPGNVYGDGQSHYKLLQASTKNWVMARFPRLSSGKLTKKYEVGYFPVGPFDTLTYEDAAHFLLSQIVGDTWLRQAPLVRASRKHHKPAKAAPKN